MCLRTQVACAYAQLLVPMSPCGQEAIPPPPEVGVSRPTVMKRVVSFHAYCNFPSQAVSAINYPRSDSRDDRKTAQHYSF
jgi:hypothetical protein